MASYQTGEIATILKGELTRGSGGNISQLLIDSRKILFARESLFFALKGENNDGHNFISDLYNNGVRNFVVSQLPENMASYPRGNFIKVENTLTALHTLVSAHRNQFNIPIIGITGSNGKTIVKEWAFQCLSPERLTVRNPKSFNSQIGVPLSVWLLQQETELGIFEAGISQPGEMQLLEKMIRPTIGIFTNIGDAHQENFESREQKITEKLKLFSNSQVLIYNTDQQQVSDLISREVPAEVRRFTWGNNPQSDLQITNTEYHLNFTIIRVKYCGTDYSVQIPFIDQASIENVMHVWALMLVFGYKHEVIARRLSQLEKIAMRLELKDGLNNCTIINDSYNSDLESLRIALDYLNVQKQHSQHILILSDIVQSGYTKPELYQLVANMIRDKKVDRLIGIGTDIQKFSTLFEVRKDFFATTQEFLSNYDFNKFQNASILLKGARMFEFERISTILQKQSHRTVMTIDLSAIEYNINYFRKLLKPETGLVTMLKAFSYGSGTHEIANLCQYKRVSMLAVAFADEGVELRRDNIHIPILVLNPEKESYEQMIEYNLEPEVYNFVTLRDFNAAVLAAGKASYPIHLKLDTGMHRSGFMPEETQAVINALKEAQGLRVSTIFSHLSSADEPAQDDYTLEQLSIFDSMSQAIKEELKYPIRRHILNSAGIERFSDKYQFDMVRLGIGLYGLSVTGAQLATVATLTSSIAQIKKLKAGTTVGYNRRGKLVVDSEIATVPIGYADGLRRSLGNGNGHMWFKGKLVPIIGNVCMDLCMIDVTGLDAHEGDPVEIFGKNLPITQVAEWMGTIPYEVLTGISRRVKRTYQYD